jgi:hypothetical protein
MKKLLCVIVSIVAFSSAGLASDAYTHAPTGVTLPANLFEFARKQVDETEKSQPGSGTCIGFERPLLYTAGLQPFPKSIDDEAIVREHGITALAILQSAKARQPTEISSRSRETFKTKWQVPTGLSTTPVLWNQYIVYMDGRATNDGLYLWLSRGHIWKLRLTRAPGAPSIDISKEFVVPIVQMSISE